MLLLKNAPYLKIHKHYFAIIQIKEIFNATYTHEIKVYKIEIFLDAFVNVFFKIFVDKMQISYFLLKNFSCHSQSF